LNSLIIDGFFPYFFHAVLPQDKFVVSWYVNIVALANASRMEEAEINSVASVKNAGIILFQATGEKKISAAGLSLKPARLFSTPAVSSTQGSAGCASFVSPLFYEAA
jgi:hypothetical protein